jgi:A/G-specific adenine glycosylase
MNSEKQFFTQNLMIWNRDFNRRSMPWKGEKNPYLIWLSEIILQQTRVAQGTAYFLKFKELFPTVKDLAEADFDIVLKTWEGLGYYSRARNLHQAAKQVCELHNGIFPQKKEQLLTLKGVGNYTASAIASFAFDQPCAVVDGNVIRILSRFFDISTPFDTTAGKKTFENLAAELIDKKNPAAYNQAIMDFGATVCSPQNPDCSSCPLSAKCKANLQGKVHLLPVKSKSIIKKERFFIFADIDAGGYTLIQKREAKDIWHNLYQFPMIEVNSLEYEMPQEDFIKKLTGQVSNFQITAVDGLTQILTHQKINAKFLQIKTDTIECNTDYENVLRKNLSNFAFPRIINLYFEKNLLNLAD